MLTATINLEVSSQRLATINIIQIDKGEERNRDYLYTIDEPEPLYADPIMATGIIRNWDRSRSAVELLSTVINDWKYNPPLELPDNLRALADRLRTRNP